MAWCRRRIFQPRILKQCHTKLAAHSQHFAYGNFVGAWSAISYRYTAVAELAALISAVKNREAATDRWLAAQAAVIDAGPAECFNKCWMRTLDLDEVKGHATLQVIALCEQNLSSNHL